jgi:hypothetical protein
MADQDTTYFELLEACQAGGCPLCRLGSRAAERFLNTLNYEGINDPGLRQALRAARGLCRAHAWQLARLRGSPLGVALIYRSVIADLLELIEEEPSTASRGRRGARKRFEPGQPCPACRAENEAVDRYAGALLAGLGDESLISSLDQAGGLCLPHLVHALELATPAQAQVLRAGQASIYRRLHAELGEFIRKHDHRFRHEPLGSEADSWRRAIAAIVGPQP